MRNFMLLLSCLMVTITCHSQITDSTAKKPKRERPGPPHPHQRTTVRLETITKQEKARKAPPLTPRWQPPRPSEKFNAQFGRAGGMVLVAGGSVLMVKMHKVYKKAKDQRAKRALLESQGYPVQYPRHGDGSIARGFGVFFSNAFIAGGTALFIIGTKKLQKYKASDIVVGASPYGANIVYTF